MPVATVYSRALQGVGAPLVTVEADLLPGLPSFQIVGLPETAVKESRERVRSALRNANFDLPDRRITINLAPADLPKAGGRYDLAIALAVLVASGQCPCAETRLAGMEFIGELSLTGEVRGVRGALPAVLASGQSQRQLVLPASNGPEAGLAPHINTRLTAHLCEVVAYLTEGHPLDSPARQAPSVGHVAHSLADVRGQVAAKRALMIAAAGGHNLLMVGPPGVGKTMLASCLPELLPPMTSSELLEVACVRSVAGMSAEQCSNPVRSFRSPHHSASAAALVGGSNPPQPGEVSLAHHGVLFLDELPEFSRHVLEVLREPLESGSVAISRASHQVRYPARFQLIAAMNPCPCGYLSTEPGRCRCREDQIQTYRGRLSGPLLDRIDLHVTVEAPEPGELLRAQPAGTDEAIGEAYERVLKARQLMQGRGALNAQLTGPAIQQHCQASQAAHDLLLKASRSLGLSARVFYKVLKVARTLADMEAAPGIDERHIGEAIAYRRLDRQQT